MKYELIITRPNGKEEVIKRNLTEKQAIEYFSNIDNTYYREQKISTENNESKYEVIKRVMESTRINADDKVYAIEMFLKGWYTKKQIEWIWA